MRGQEHVASDLHGDGAGALADAAGAGIGQRGAQNALPINTMVPEEAVIFGGEEGLDELRRKLVITDGYAPLLTDRGDQPAVTGIDPQGDLKLDFPETVHIREGGP